jgi:hypothetical protein
MIQKQARKFDLLTNVRTNHCGEMVKNWVGVTFQAMQTPDHWEFGIFGECIESPSGEVEVDDLEWGIPEHSRERLQVEYSDAAASPARSMSISIVHPRAPIERVRLSELNWDGKSLFWRLRVCRIRLPGRRIHICDRRQSGVVGL